MTIKALSGGMYFLLLIFIHPSCQTDPGRKQADSPPNIVLIFVDDMGYGDLGRYGALGYETPHLDRMAANGAMLTQFYSAQAVCSASRAALLTGCYPNRVGISGALFPGSRIGLNREETTIAEMLKQQGYATAMFGKWHLGHVQPYLPLQHGFDEYTGLPYSNDMWPVDFDGRQVDSTSWKARYPQLPLIEGNEKIREIRTLEDQAELTALYTEKAVDFIRRKADSSFFLYVPHSMPHVPIAASEKFRGKSEQGIYGDVIMEIDWSVGQILDALEETGQTENTLVIFTSDNGPWLNFGNHAGNTGGLREGKGTSWEGGQRVPCIIQWPGKVPAGAVYNQLTSTIDILPTIASITEAPLPQRKIDGLDQSAVWFGSDTVVRREFLYYYHNNHLEAVRKDRWKLVLPHRHRTYKGHLPGNDGHPGPVSQDSTGLALFNLRRDPGEYYDVKDLYPEKVEELMKVVEAAREDLGDALTRREGIGRRKPGTIE